MKSRFTIGKLISGGLGLVLVLLTAVAAIAFVGIAGIVDNASQVIEANKIRGEIVQREVDHLKWANSLTEYLSSTIETEWVTQTNPKECKLGKFLYGDTERPRAENLVPEIAPMFEDILEPHERLHQSAKDIQEVFEFADPELPATLANRIIDHLNWAIKVRSAMNARQDSLGVQTDPTKCALGKWIASDEGKAAYEGGNEDFKEAWKQLLDTHANLHASATLLEENLAFNELDTAKSEANQSVEQMKEDTDKLLALLEAAKEEVVEPERIAAERAGNIEDFERWSRIDIATNESVIQPLLKTLNKVTKVSLTNSSVELNEAKTAAAELVTRKDSWYTLLENTKMVDTGNQTSEILSSLQSNLDQFFTVSESLETAKLKVDKAEEIFNTNTVPVLNETVGLLASLQEQAELAVEGRCAANSILSTTTMPLLNQVRGQLDAIHQTVQDNMMTDEEMFNAASNTKKATLYVSILAFAAGIIGGFFIRRHIISALSKTIDLLSSSSEQVSAASSQVASSSQSMAEGASESAASIEETSASLEQLAASTQQNKSNTKTASDRSTETRIAAENGREAMQRMNDVMAKIKDSSDQTAKIIKTIDEIAFQTNLLALNAAVEAARAGEAGKGFAVVAEEVRNLAHRSADAAKTTTQLIDESRQNAESGVNASAQVSENLDQVVEAVNAIAALIEGVAGASEEQSQGIEEVNNAISQMNAITQSNASNAEETAAASEELSRQAVDLSDMIVGLAELAGMQMHHQKNPAITYDRNLKTSKSKTLTLNTAKREIAKPVAAKTVTPEDVLPLDDEDLNDF